MAVKETVKEARDPRVMLAVAGLVLGALLIGGVIYWLVKPSAVRQVKLNEKQAQEVGARGEIPAGPPLPAAPMPQIKDPGPTLVTLDLKNASAQDAVQALSKQGKYPVQFGNQQSGIMAALLAQRGDISIQNQPFWAAYFQLAKQLQLSPLMRHEEGQRNSIGLTSGGDTNFTKCPMTMSGSFMLVLHNVTSTFSTDVVTGRTNQREAIVAFTTFAEPKLNTYRISAAAVVEQAVDEKGTSLVRPRDPYDDRYGSHNGTKWRGDVRCRLAFPENAGQRIAMLRGYISVAVSDGKTQTVTIKDPLKARNVDHTIDGQIVRLMALQKQGANSYRAQLATDANSPVAKDWESIRSVATLSDASGRKFDSNGTSMGYSRGATVEFGLYFNGEAAASEPTEMHITWPTGIKEIRVPFQFTDLPLPH